tara:strand:+ start:559 stop:738 length:180 start_codon:yes stop_codon:yes gene_type:complete
MWAALLALPAVASAQELAALVARIDKLEKDLKDSTSLNTPLWMLLCGVLVMFMQVTFYF